MARVTGLEPAASAVTGRRSNQLSYTRAKSVALFSRQPPSLQAVFTSEKEFTHETMP
jgi:hypothetical protein